MLDASQITIAALVMLAGSFVLSTVGFGIGVATSPVLLLVMEPQAVVVMINTVSLVILALIVWQSTDHLPLREMLPIAIAGVLGVPVGVVALTNVSATGLRIGIVGLILVLTIAFALNIRATIPRPRATGPLVGFVVGALVTGLAIGGPLMVLFLLSRNWIGQEVRAGMSFFYLAIAATAVMGYAIAGLFTLERTTLILIVTAPALLGFALATVLVRRMNERRFRQGVVAVIMFTSLMVLGREALQLQGVI